jgi:hypothetical protein
MNKMENFDLYIIDVKEQLECNATEEFKKEFITYSYTNEQIDKNLDYFKKCQLEGLSGYKALLYFCDYLEC